MNRSTIFSLLATTALVTSLSGCVIVDKNARIGDGARLVNAKGINEADGDSYFIRNGVIIVPKDAVIPEGFSV